MIVWKLTINVLGYQVSSNSTDLLSNSTATRINDVYDYYLDADYQQVDDLGATWVHKNPYFTSGPSNVYYLYISDPDFNISFNINHPQNVSHNFTLQDSSGTPYDLVANTWITVDYSGVVYLNSNNIVMTVTIPTSVSGSGYSDIYYFRFYAHTTDQDHPVGEVRFATIYIIDDPINLSTIHNADIGYDTKTYILLNTIISKYIL